MTIYFVNLPVSTRSLSRFRNLNRVVDEGKTTKSLKRLKSSKHVNGIIFDETADRELLDHFRSKRIPCMFYSKDSSKVDKYIESLNIREPLQASRFGDGYEVTTCFDFRFSPFHCKIGNISIEDYYQLVIKGNELLGAKSWRDCKGSRPLVVTPVNYAWSRDFVKSQSHKLFIFTDNLLRTSGRNPIMDSSYYVCKYGRKCYSNSSQAVIRGLNNAYPITTMADYNKTQLSDEYLDEMRGIWTSEINDIRRAYRKGDYTEIVCSSRIFGSGTYSDMKNCAPKCYKTLTELLKGIGINNEGEEVLSNYPPRSLYDEYKKCYTKWLSDNPEMIIELLELTKDKHLLTDRFWVTEISQAKALSEIINTYILKV